MFRYCFMVWSAGQRPPRKISDSQVQKCASLASCWLETRYECCSHLARCHCGSLRERQLCIVTERWSVLDLILTRHFRLLELSVSFFGRHLFSSSHSPFFVRRTFLLRQTTTITATARTTKAALGTDGWIYHSARPAPPFRIFCASTMPATASTGLLFDQSLLLPG